MRRQSVSTYASILPGSQKFLNSIDMKVTIMFCFLATKLILGFLLQVDWTLNIGEQALDISIMSFNQSASSVFVLGERNFFCLKDNGQIQFMKKLDCSPSCFLPYCSGV